jgi:hypothetical protein
MSDDEYYEDIVKNYIYDNKNEKTSVRFFPDKNIATVTETDFTGEESIEVGIAEEGMTREELEKYFPPLPAHAKQGHTYNLLHIIKSVIYEAFKKEGLNLEEGNVRNFWYTHLKKMITEILGLGETSTVLSTINTAWDQMINSGMVNYEDMNIVGGKESNRVSVVRDSPFSNLIIAVEKVDYFHMYQWIPRLFNSTLITAGGQPSRTVARAFIRELKELAVDLDQDFFMCTISDLDPAGYYIQEAFRKQFESAIRYYGGTGNIQIRRIFVREDQITPELLISQAMPCQDKAKSDKARKAEDTKWDFFCKMTNGGIYIPAPSGWTGPTYEKDGQTVVRALLEMNAFSKEVIERSIIKELLKIIEETADESKIMIPEIMRIFQEMRGTVSERKYKEWYSHLIEPLKRRFLKDTSDWSHEIWKIYSDAKKEIETKYEEQINEQYGIARENEPELWAEKDRIEEEIAELEKQLENVDSEIQEKCSEQYDEISNLEEKRDNEIEEKEEERDYKNEKLAEFRDERATVFNPLEQNLKNKINEYVFNDPELQFYFKDIEMMSRFQKHIAKMLTDPDLLLVDMKSCFEHPVFAFLEQDLLHQASQVKDDNVGNVRKSFPRAFTDEMVKYLLELVKEKQFTIDEDMVEFEDLSSEVAELKEKTNKAIDDGSWKEEESEEE